MMPGLVVKHTNNNVAILECLTSMPEQAIVNNKLETMEIQQTTESSESKTDENLENPTKEYQEISQTQTEENRVDNTENLENLVPENNSTDVNEKTEELSIKNCEQNVNKAEELPDTMDVPKYPDKEKEPPEKMENPSAAAAKDENSENSISVNIGEPSTSKINHKKQNKLKTFLNKYNVTEGELMLKLKNMKRLTKDKIKLDSVLSHKLNRNYLKILKRRRSIKNNSTNSYTATTNKDSSDEYSTCESEDSGRGDTSSSATIEEAKITAVEEAKITTAEEDIKENAHDEKKIHDIHSEALMETEFEETTTEVVSNKSEISENGFEKSTEHPEESITEDQIVTNKVKDSLENENIASQEDTYIEKQIKEIEKNSEVQENTINTFTTSLLEIKEITYDSSQDEDKNLQKNKTASFESEISKNSDELIIDSNETEKTSNIEQNLLELSQFSKNSDESIIDSNETKKSINNEENLSENKEINANSEIEKISDDSQSNSIELDKEIPKETNNILEETFDDNSSDDGGVNSLVIDENEKDEDFMTLLESLEKEVPPSNSIKNSQKETEIIEDQDKIVNAPLEIINISEDENEQPVQVDEDPLNEDKVLSVGDEEPNLESQTQNDSVEDIECIDNLSEEQCVEEEVDDIPENSGSSNKDCENKFGEPSSSSSPLTILPHLFEDDDIRNKIKQQLELLRRNTRKSITVEPIIENETESVQNEDIETSPINSPSASVEEIPAETINEEINTPNVNTGPDLSDVLISNEGELAIINVVGGYVSENEDEEEKIEDEIEEVPQFEDTTKNLKRGISITDRLLMNFSQDNSHIIKPTKTTDITKIKGWRSKTFNVTNEEHAKSNIEEIEEVHIEEKVPPLIFYKSKETNSSLQDPLPGTSTSFVIQQQPEVSKTSEPSQEEIKLPEEGNKNSAFFSDYLETFLSTNSELKISYEVPKLVAEENISKPEEIMPLADFPPQPSSELNTTTTYKPKQSATKKAKPKTLAEKRRMLESDRRNELLHDMEMNELIYLKRLEYCEKRNKTETANDIRNNLVANVVPFSRLCWKLATKERRQFAVCQGEKILLSGSAGGEDIIVPVTKLNRFNSKSAGGKVITATNSGFRPGPLSMKPKLIMQDNWECHVLKMPKIKLEVYPEQNKPLPLIAQQYLQLCRHDQYVVNKNWADFAVTAVQTKDKTPHPNKFEFDIPYANGRNKILVRVPRKLSPVKYPERTYSNRFPEINVEENIKDIVSDLLTCVENRELDTKIIKDDPDLNGLFATSEKDVDRPLSPIDSKVQAIFKRPNARRSKTTLELRRLNVQVIEVDVKEDESIPENCTKDFCNLGCICKSLRGASAIIPEHCGREECMLECHCSFGTLQKGRHQITLPAGTDLLSASTVVRLQDEAKRNLAKEEREFTQTVIKANNQTIMVGGGARERTRRVPKVPKKYTNFAVDKPNPKGVSSYDKMMSEGSIEEEYIEIETEKTPPKKKPEIEGEEPVFVETKKPVPIWINKDKQKHGKRLRPEGACRVVLTPIKLDHLMPWCMVHNLYKCHCGGKATFPENTEPVKPIQTPIEDTEYISYNPRFGGVRHAETTPHTVTDVTEKYCARTKALPTNYYHARNKSQRFKADYAVMKQKEEKNTHFDNINPTNSSNKNKRKSLDTYETYSNDNISFDNQDLLVPIKKKSSYIKKRDSQSLLLPQMKRTSEMEEAENQAKRSKLYEEEEDEDALESLSLLERLKGPNNQNSLSTVKSYQRVPVDAIAKMVRKTKKLKPKVIMRGPDKLKPSLHVKNMSPESLQLTSEDFVAASNTKLSFPEQKRRLENTHIVSSTAFIDYDRSFMGLLIPSREWIGRFHKMLNPNENTIIHQIRLLEWATMVRRQECNALQVWFNTKKYNNIILTEDRRRPSSGHVNVKTFKSYSLQNFKMPDIISSLLSDKLPGAAEKASETYMILVFNGINWEARGTIVLSGTTEICRQKLALKPAPTSILTPNLGAPMSQLKESNALVKQSKSPVKQYSPESGRGGPGTLIIKSTPAMSVEVRNLKEPASSVPPKLLTSKSSSELEIISLPPSTTTSPVISENNYTKEDNENSIPVIDRTKYNIGSILAPLPTGGDLHRWFMLILENDFSVLRISFSKFHIKYTHLQTAINMARKSQKTVRIKTPPVNCPDVSENFSIYACPENTQRIFFGPYGNRSDHGLETFRYVNGKLVNTKIYNKMRGNPERKTSGYWFTHNSTMNNNLNLEPNYDEGSSGSECATAVTSIDNVTKPLIELVDLTENDSDAEEATKAPSKDNEMDPLLSLLSVDLSKKVTNDITIEAIPFLRKEPPEKLSNAKNDISIEAITEPKSKKQGGDRKRKSMQDDPEEPVAKHPTLIDSIELDDDDEMPVLEPYNKDQGYQKKSPNTKMPPLRPINTNASKEKDKDKTKNKRKCLYVITNIPGVGYFEIFFEKTKTNRQSMYTQIKGSKTTFQTINNAIKYLHYLCTKCIYFMPKTLKVKFSIVDSSEPPEMPKFKDEYLDGYHMISERGIFNILNINTKDLDNMGFDEEEIQKLLSYKCDLLIARNIKQLGTFLFGHEAAKKMPQDEILRMAPGKIKLMEQQETNLLEEKNSLNIRQQNLITLLGDLTRDIPEYLQNLTKQKIAKILEQKSPVRDITNWNEPPIISLQESSKSTIPAPDIPRTLINSQKSDSPAVVNPILSKLDPAKFTLLSNSAMLTKTLNPLPVGKFCRIVDGKLIVLDKNKAAKPSAASGATPRLQVVPNIQPTMNLLSPQQFQNLINPNPSDKNSKFELLVPISGLQSPATVVTFGQQNVQNTTIAPNPSTLLVANNQPKVVDLTDD